jgi:tRNA isopentenyl-2-thiomethyl-A-37 hydroxylase MiaE
MPFSLSAPHLVKRGMLATLVAGTAAIHYPSNASEQQQCDQDAAEDQIHGLAEVVARLIEGPTKERRFHA